MIRVDPVTEGRRAVIIATAADVLEPLVEASGHEVVGVSDCGVSGERLLAHLRPDVVVVENDLRGDPGWFVIPRLQASSPGTGVLLLVTEDWTPRDMGSGGAVAVMTMSQLGELGDALEALAERHESEAAASAARDERRHGPDRRVHQDWNKVGWEYRKSTRRAGDAA